MAQIRLRDYREPLASFDHNVMQLRNSAGRFKGFDTMVITGTLTFNVSHAATGFTFKDQSQNTVGPCGELQTKQGVFIIENAILTGFAIDTNAGNPNDRIDLLVCNHQYVNVAGGQAATYSIIKGPIASNTPPNLTNPDYQIIVARIIIPAGATNINQATYVKERCPDSGDGLDARLNEVNKFNTFNQFNFSPTIYNSNTHWTNIGGVICWTFNPDGNVFDAPLGAAVSMDAIRVGKELAQEGTFITVRTNALMTVRCNTPLPSAAAALGYTNIFIPSSLSNRVVNSVSGRVVALVPTTVAGRWSLTFLRAGGQWVLVSVQSHEDVVFKRGMIIDAYLDSTELSDNFDATGLGKNLYEGWALCNGINNTIDLRGRFIVMATDGPEAGANPLDSSLVGYSIGQIGGQNSVTLTVSQMPHHNHPISGSSQGNNAGGGSVPAVNFTGLENAGFTDGTGGDQAHENRPPFRALYKIQRIL